MWFILWKAKGTYKLLKYVVERVRCNKRGNIGRVDSSNQWHNLQTTVWLKKVGG
jgi:hypothetical protein